MSGARSTLALLGMRCSGKSSVGRRLALEIGRPFVDLDEEVLRFGGFAGLRVPTVGALLETAGRARFREFEAAALRRLLEPCLEIVLATGGGVVERADNRVWLRRTAFSIFLSVPAAILRERLRKDATARPALLGTDAVDEVEELLARREPLYRDTAQLVIECDDESSEAIASRIARSPGAASPGAVSPDAVPIGDRAAGSG